MFAKAVIFYDLVNLCSYQVCPMCERKPKLDESLVCVNNTCKISKTSSIIYLILTYFYSVYGEIFPSLILSGVRK